VTLPVKFIGTAKSKLDEVGKAKVKANLTFAPTGGSALTKAKALRLKRTLGGWVALGGYGRAGTRGSPNP
jgi:hypothetical protein